MVGFVISLTVIFALVYGALNLLDIARGRTKRLISRTKQKLSERWSETANE